MRCLLLAVVAGLAFVAPGTLAQDVAPVEDALTVDFDQEELTQILQGLFDESDFENREARARDDGEESAVEDKAVAVDPKDQTRYNNFIDTFLRRLNTYSRSRFDPLSIGLERKEAKNDKAKKGSKSNKKKSNKKKSKKDKKNKNNKRKGKRHPKDLDLDEVEEEQVEQVEVEEQEVEEEHSVVKREVIEVFEIEEEEEEEEEADLEEEEDEEDSLVRVTRDADEDESQDGAVETSRRGKPAAGGNKKAKKGKGKSGGKKNKKKGKDDKKGGKQSKKGGKKKGKKSAKKGGKSKRSSNTGPRTSRATVTGIATLVRDGDVKIQNSKNGKSLKAAFKLGAVELSVDRKYGKGDKAVVKEAKAIAPELSGKFTIEVKANGEARMASFRINKPSIVQTEGSLRKSTKGKDDNNNLERSIAKVTPVAVKKLKMASRSILSGSSGKEKATPEA